MALGAQCCNFIEEFLTGQQCNPSHRQRRPLGREEDGSLSAQRWGAEHSLLCFFSNSQGKTADWSPGRVCHQWPSPGKDQLLPILYPGWSVLDPVFLASHITRAYWLAPENLFNLVNDNIYIILLFFQFLGSPKGKKKSVRWEQKGKSTFLLAEGKWSQVSLPSFPSAPWISSVSKRHEEPGCKVPAHPLFYSTCCQRSLGPYIFFFLDYCHELPQDSSIKPLNYNTIEI